MDNLRGSESFGDKKSLSKPWAIPFDHLEFDKVVIKSLDGTSYIKEFDHGGRRIIGRMW